jgi:LysM repeat protein
LAAVPHGELPTSYSVPNRVGRPLEDERTVLDAATFSPSRSEDSTIAHGPARVHEVEEAASTYAPSAASAPEGQARVLPRLAANLVNRTANSGVPVFSSLAQGLQMSGATRLAPGKVTVDRPQGGRVSAPRVTAAEATVAQPTKNPRLAMSQPMDKPEAVRPHAAIQVAPLEVNTADALPAFHKVERTTTLRAVAARYGVPVEVLATCNNWTPEMKLVSGMKVKMPRQLQISYHGKPVKSDVASLMVGSTSVTPFRFLWEQQGGKLEWDAKNKQVTAINGDRKIVVTVGSRNAQVNDQDVMMELAAFLMSGRTMVPVRLFEEGLHAQVEWDPATGRLYVAMAN